MPRKTVSVESLLRQANAMLAAKGSTPDGREAVCALLESVLLETGNYVGFRYLDTNEVEGAGTRRQYAMKGVGFEYV